jgi:hypothetical protein
MKFRNTFVLATLVAPLVAPLALVGACFGMVGCAEKVEDTGPKEEELPNLDVKLPPSPDFDEARAPVKWEGDPDSAYSIFGLRKDIDDRLKEGEAGQKVVVKGYVQEIYTPPECPEGQLCPPGKQPHFWISDSPDEKGKKRAMMVVNYHFPIPEWDTDTLKQWEAQPLVIVELGKQYTITGEFKRFSNSGFAHDNGLLEFHSYKAPNPDPESSGELIWIYPPNSDWHPQTVAATEAENAEMQARMQKDAEMVKNQKGE